VDDAQHCRVKAAACLSVAVRALDAALPHRGRIPAVHAISSQSCHTKGRKLLGHDWPIRQLSQCLSEESATWWSAVSPFFLGFSTLDMIG
jgi:hypothetical protein